jgi:hypothetical protein
MFFQIWKEQLILEAKKARHLKKNRYPIDAIF